MYDKYFHSKVIDKALQSDEYTDLDWESYMFRILNLTNTNSDLDALPSLREIKSLIFGNVKKLKSTSEAFDIALKVFDVIVNNIDVKIENPTEKQSEEGNGNESIEAGDSDENKGGESNESGEGKEKIELTPAQKRQLENAVRKQDKFMKGDIQKKKLSKKDKASMDSVEAAGMSYVDVANDVKDSYYGKKSPTKVLMVKKFNKALAESDTISMIYNPSWRWS